MTDLFLTVLNLSLRAGYVILFIMLVRLPLKKAPKGFSYGLWSVAAFRLLCPFSFESILSLLPINASPIPLDIAYQQIPQINSGITPLDAYVNRALPEAAAEAGAAPLQIYLQTGAFIWLAGVAAMLIYSVVSVLILKNRLKGARSTGENSFEADDLKTPFVLGIFRPRIYIPAGLTEEEKRCIILHEKTHIRRFDHFIKPFAFVVLSIHWFNPLVWAAFILMGTDMELSCDERVLRELGGGIKKTYSASLLSLAAGNRILNGSPLAFGEGNVKGRIKNVLNFKKPAVWGVAVSAVLVAAVGIGLAINPMDDASPSNWELYRFPSYEYDRIAFLTDAAEYSPMFKEVSATLTNLEMESGLMCGNAFVLVKETADHWRIVPFKKDTAFYQTAMELAIGGQAVYTLTPEMLEGGLEAGKYRIVTEVWYKNESPPQTKRAVWADFTVSKRKAESAPEDVPESTGKDGDPVSGTEAVTDILYTEEEIQAAMDCVRKYFAEVATVRILNDLWFDEEACATHRASYMQYGRGKSNGVSEANVIVLLCNFTIEDDESFQGYYPGWLMILIRDGENGAWRIDGQGV